MDEIFHKFIQFEQHQEQGNKFKFVSLENARSGFGANTQKYLYPYLYCIIPGPLYSGVAADMFGRRLTILTSGIPLVIGWILAATAKGVGQLYAARIIWGLAVGQLFTCVPMYVGEIAEVRDTHLRLS